MLNACHHDYLLYLWYVEDVLRAFGCDMELIVYDYLLRLCAQVKDDTQRSEYTSLVCRPLRNYA